EDRELAVLDQLAEVAERQRRRLGPGARGLLLRLRGREALRRERVGARRRAGRGALEPGEVDLDPGVDPGRGLGGDAGRPLAAGDDRSEKGEQRQRETERF